MKVKAKQVILSRFLINLFPEFQWVFGGNFAENMSKKYSNAVIASSKQLVENISTLSKILIRTLSLALLYILYC